jgi:Arc/MetJ-type ribon-helix-helix transcriptional regulator
MKTVTIELPDEQAAALEQAVADGGFASAAAFVRAAIQDFAVSPIDYDPDALARDVARHRAEKSRGDGGHSPAAARTWLRSARPT